MSYEEGIKKNEAKNYIGKNMVEGVRQLINKNNMLFFCKFVLLNNLSKLEKV